ncbi:MAG: DUF2764 domain-containing protein [Pseudomonadales bacterium]|nr:DUF2764 domain-containing protein [Pseudomonadales bacterium]
MNSDQYITLMSALPSLGKTYHVDIPPISRFQLEKRLNLLTEEHQALLSDIESVLHWDHLNSHYDDSELIQSATLVLEQLTHKHYDTLREMILWRLNLRTILAGLRYRQRGDELNHQQSHWGVGDMEAHIETYWQHPYFNLQSRFHWIASVQESLQKNDTMQVERILFDVTWQYLQRCSSQHYFDFTAVVTYVLRWNLVSRWSSYDADKGVEHFQSLMAFALGEYQQLSMGIVVDQNGDSK